MFHTFIIHLYIVKRTSFDFASFLPWKATRPYLFISQKLLCLQQESKNLSENSRTESTAIDEQNSYRNEDPGLSILHQELMDPVSVSSFPFFSPRSVLPEKTLRVQVVSSPAFDQQIRTRASRLNIEGIPPTSSARAHIHETMPEPLPLRVDPLAQTLSDASSNAEVWILVANFDLSNIIYIDKLPNQ